MKYTDITSHEIACRVLKKDPKKVTSIHDQMITDIFDAVNKLNGNFKADFSNDLGKCRPCFIMDSSGFSFHHSYYDSRHSITFVGSRLCNYVS